MTSHDGISLVELILTLTVLGILSAIAIPRSRHGLDAMKVRSAREAAYGVATQARALALARGGAELVLDPEQRTIVARTVDGAEVARADLAVYDVDIADGAASAGSIVLRYDAHGIGRIASRTVYLRRHAAQAGLTFSSYGRVRRW